MRPLIAALTLSLALVVAVPVVAQDDAAEPVDTQEDATTPAEDVASAITYAGGDGLTMETAVVIVGAEGEMDGVDAEYRWLAEHAPDGERDAQSLVTAEDGRVFDAIVVAWPDGTKRTYFFEITAFFGKL